MTRENIKKLCLIRFFCEKTFEMKLIEYLCNRKNQIDMKVTIIGAGNMGGAIARGLAKGHMVKVADITVSDPSVPILQSLKKDYPEMAVTGNNAEAVRDAELIIVAVKPWLMQSVLSGLTWRKEQVLVSVAAGVTFEQLVEFTGNIGMTMFRLIPNTAISQLESMTLIASYKATPEQEELLLGLFNEMGLAMLVPESQMGAATAVTSCGIAYVLKYIQAAMQAGVEMGLYPKDAQRMVAQSVKGAAALILENDTHPAVEIDKVTTPGGITIKGLNELEHAGFTSAIVKAMKASR